MPQRSAFWDAKILVWDGDRYEPGGSGPSATIRRAMGRSIRARTELALARLVPIAGGRDVVELGCGTGRLAPALLEAGARSYLGLDFAPSAIAHARALAEARGLGPRARFEVADVAALPPLDAGLVVSLGLLDWLDDASIVAVFRAGGSAEFLHSYSERRRSLAQSLHRAYVHLAYGHRTAGYVPAYHTAAQIEVLAAAGGRDALAFVRDARMSFGTFAVSRPAFSTPPCGRSP